MRPPQSGFVQVGFAPVNFRFARDPTGSQLHERQYVTASKTDNQVICDRNPTEQSNPQIALNTGL
jgi:hypothetical protein